jgi:hypothetical protein
MKMRNDDSTVSKVTIRIIVSIMFGLVAFGLSAALQARNNIDAIVGVGVSVFVSGIAFVVQFLIEVDDQVLQLGKELKNSVSELQDSVKRLGESYREELAQISQATELFGLVERSALKTDKVAQLVRDASTVEDGVAPLIYGFAQAEMDRLSELLRYLGQQAEVPYDGEDRDWLLGLTRVAGKTIDATSLTTVDAGGRGFVDEGLWSSDLGQRYLEAQKEAVKVRHVRIRRIFIFDRPDLGDDVELQVVVREHHQAGIEVRTLHPSMLNILRPPLLDFIVFDGVLVYQSSPGATNLNSERRPRIVSTRLVTQAARVASAAQRYEELWAAATPYVPPEPQPSEPNHRTQVPKQPVT